MEYIETKFRLAYIFIKALDAATIVKFRDMAVVSASISKVVVEMAKEPKKDNNEESAEKMQRK